MKDIDRYDKVSHDLYRLGYEQAVTSIHTEIVENNELHPVEQGIGLAISNLMCLDRINPVRIAAFAMEDWNAHSVASELFEIAKRIEECEVTPP